jgi:hypothetical protein
MHAGSELGKWCGGLEEQVRGRAAAARGGDRRLGLIGQGMGVHASSSESARVERAEATKSKKVVPSYARVRSVAAAAAVHA